MPSKLLHQRVVDFWNRLPLSVVDSDSVGTFKNRIDKFMDAREDGQ
jgi:hypothetical protein